MDLLGRYYTNHLFSELLVKNLESENPATVLDLGAGGGSLIKAALDRWNNAEIIAADIDPSSVKKISHSLPLVKVYKANGLKVNIEKNIDLTKSSIDVAICNPPYLQVKEKERFKNLLVEAELYECLKMKKLTSDIVFLAQNLKLLKLGGELGIILPDSILTGQEFRLLRNALLTHHNLKGIIELPERIFPKTEAKTHILLIEKTQTSKDRIPLLIAGKDGKCYDQIDIVASALENRMDFSYHKINQAIPKLKSRPLGSYNITLKRGNMTNAESKTKKIKSLHSTSFKDGAELHLINSNKRKFENLVYAERGDLVIVRVGRGCVGKVALVKQGKLPITDCLYVVKADENIISALWKFLISSNGDKWVDANSHGVCAKVLNRTDIFDIPITL